MLCHRFWSRQTQRNKITAIPHKLSGYLVHTWGANRLSVAPFISLLYQVANATASHSYNAPLLSWNHFIFLEIKVAVCSYILYCWITPNSHTWGQELNFHPHIHCIVSGGGLTSDKKLKACGRGFFIPAKVMAAKFCGKLLSCLDSYYRSGALSFNSCKKLQNSYEWRALRNKLYEKTWCPDIRETFNGFGNAIEYLAKLVESARKEWAMRADARSDLKSQCINQVL